MDELNNKVKEVALSAKLFDIYVCVKDNPGLTRRAIMDKTGNSYCSVTNALSRLRQKELIVGGGYNGTYHVIEGFTVTKARPHNPKEKYAPFVKTAPPKTLSPPPVKTIKGRNHFTVVPCKEKLPKLEWVNGKLDLSNFKLPTREVT